MKRFISQDLAILILYSLGYSLWYTLLGPGFKTYKLLDFSHYLNPLWLQKDLLESLVYLHSQPPLMNLLIGLIFKFTPEHYEAVFRTLYFIAGGAAVVFLTRTMRLLGVSPALRALSIFALCFTPTMYMFGTWYFSTHLEFSIACGLIYLLACYCFKDESRRTSLAAIFICFALLGLIRPQWHLFLFLLLCVGLARIGCRGLIKTLLLYALIFLLPVGGWYAKNYVVFGFFGGSSWMGANVAQVAQKAVVRDLRELREAQIVATDFPGDFSMQKILRRFPEDVAGSMHPALGAYKSQDHDFLDYAKSRGAEHYVIYNLNYIGIIPSARQDMKDALIIIKREPWQYVKTVFHQFYIMALSPSFFSPSLNLLSVERMARSVISNPALSFLVYNMGALLLYLITPVIILFETLRCSDTPRRQFLWLLLFILAFMSATACLLNGYEQERMRWGWQGIYVIFAAILLENARKWWKNSRHGRTAEY